MPHELQAKLLRVLETGRVVRVGGEQELPIDVRVIAATNRVPEEAVKDGKLRQDLLYRLSVFRVGLPPVRDRPGDVDILASTSSAGSEPRRSRRTSASRGRRSRRCARTAGRATSASSRTPSTARTSWRTT